MEHSCAPVRRPTSSTCHPQYLSISVHLKEVHTFPNQPFLYLCHRDWSYQNHRLHWLRHGKLDTKSQLRAWKRLLICRRDNVCLPDSIAGSVLVRVYNKSWSLCQTVRRRAWDRCPEKDEAKDFDCVYFTCRDSYLSSGLYGSGNYTAKKRNLQWVCILPLFSLLLGRLPGSLHVGRSRAGCSLLYLTLDSKKILWKKCTGCREETN